jgi:hypothetical protein
MLQEELDEGKAREVGSMSRCVVNVATGPHYRKGQYRLFGSEFISETSGLAYTDVNMPRGCPDHSLVPYAFKAFALRDAAQENHTLLWCDACILPVADMTPLWERIERDGYWFSECGFNNYEWTADSVYPDLFELDEGRADEARALNRTIPHVVATAFGLSMKHPKGRAFLDEYYRLASETKAFCGPWVNSDRSDYPLSIPLTGPRCYPCGPPDVRGHRHDQTAASVIAWRLGMQLTKPPEIFAYGRADEKHDPRTILLASGEYGQ